MQLSFETLADKIRGCWQGKNIGGILGAPFEGYRQINDVKFYTQDLEKGLPRRTTTSTCSLYGSMRSKSLAVG